MALLHQFTPEQSCKNYFHAHELHTPLSAWSSTLHSHELHTTAVWMHPCLRVTLHYTLLSSIQQQCGCTLVCVELRYTLISSMQQQCGSTLVCVELYITLSLAPYNSSVDAPLSVWNSSKYLSSFSLLFIRMSMMDCGLLGLATKTCKRGRCQPI